MPEPYLAVHHPSLKPVDLGDGYNPQALDSHTQATEILLETVEAVSLIIGRDRTAILLHQAGDALQ